MLLELILAAFLCISSCVQENHAGITLVEPDIVEEKDSEEVEDVKAAFKFIKQRYGDKPIAFYGFSMSASAMLMSKHKLAIFGGTRVRVKEFRSLPYVTREMKVKLIEMIDSHCFSQFIGSPIAGRPPSDIIFSSDTFCPSTKKRKSA